jgi:mannosyltransferase OCH1-like enzyme
MRSKVPPQPATIFQFWDRDPPSEIVDLMNTWKLEQPGFLYRAFDAEAALTFITDNIGAEAGEAYRECKLPAMKADFFRYCALYASGGIYIDADTQNRGGGLRPLYDQLDRGMLFLRKANVANDFMIVKAVSDPLMRYAIDRAIVNIKSRKSNNVWEVTGPGILTALFHSAGTEKEMMFKGYSIYSVRDIRKVMSFKWDLEYKKRDNHWVNYGDSGNSIFESVD